MSWVQWRDNWLALGVLLSVFGFAGCSGGDGLAGIEGTGSPADPIASTQGSVTALGSIYVNGQAIETSGAEIHVNGKAAEESDLELGMVVKVELDPETDSAIALRINHERELLGPVEEVRENTPLRKILVVMGRLVIVNDDSLLSGLNFEALEAGRRVEVSGFTDAQNRLWASRVSLASPAQRLEVEGVVTNVDAIQAHFTLGALQVDYSESLFDGTSADLLAEGVRLRLEGGGLVAGVYRPEVIRAQPAAQLESGGTLFREGVIRDFVTLSDWRLGELRVNAADAAISGDSTRLTEDARVSVSGVIDSEGVLQARQLTLISQGINRIRARVDALNPEAQQLTLLGEDYQLTALSNFENRRPDALRFNNLGQLSPGDWVEVHSLSDGNGQRVRRLKRLGVGAFEVELRGPVTAIDVPGQSLRLLGVDVLVENSEALAFLRQLTEGDLVSLSGRLTGVPPSLVTDRLNEVPGLAQLPVCVPLLTDCSEPGPSGNAQKGR